MGGSSAAMVETYGWSPPVTQKRFWPKRAFAAPVFNGIRRAPCSRRSDPVGGFGEGNGCRKMRDDWFSRHPSTTRSSLFCRLPRCGVCVSSGPRCEELLCVPPPRARSSARRGMYSFFLFFAPHSSYVPKWTEICKARLVFVVYAPTPFSMTSSVV